MPRVVGKFFSQLVRFYGRVGMYFLLLLAGIQGLFWIPPAFDAVDNALIRIAWSVCLIIGGITCIWGLWRFSYRPQIIGTVFCAAGVLTHMIALAPALLESLTIMIVFAAFTHGLIARMHQLKTNDDAGVPGSGSFWRSWVAQDRAGPDSGWSYRSGRVAFSSMAEGEDQRKVDLGPKARRRKPEEGLGESSSS